MKHILCIGFVLAQTTLLGQVDNKTKSIVPKRQVQSVEVSRVSKTISVTYRDGTKEELTEKEANDRGYVHNAGYGNFANGTVVIKNSALRIAADSSKPLIILNGKEYDGKLDNIEAKTIESINVLKDDAAKTKYGEKGKFGVIEIYQKPAEVVKGEGATEWLGKKIYQLLGAAEGDEIVSYELSVQDENEDIIVTRQRGSVFNEAGQKALAKARKGSPVIFEKIRVKRDGKEFVLPATTYKR